MPTQKPRLAITLPAELYDTIRRFAAYERQPMAKVITGLLIEIGPMLQSTVAALDQVQKSKGAPAAALATAITRMQGTVEQLASKASGQLDFLHRDVVAAASASDERSGSGADRPPPRRRKKAVKGRKRAGRS